MNWEAISIDELSAIPLRNGIYKGEEFQGRGLKIVNMKELFSFDFIRNQEMRRIELNEAEIIKNTLEVGDLLFARRSVVADGAGKVSIVKELEELITFESSIIRVRLKQNKVSPSYLFYYFKSPIGKGQILSISTGANVKGIKGSELKKLRVPLPPPPTQQKIAAILSAYDDLIENNLRRIRLLEEAGQHLYREWFVRFQFPGWEEVKWVEGLPEGWERRKLSDILELNYGKALKAEDRKEGTVPVFGSSGVVGFHNVALVKAPGIIVGRKGNVGSVFWSFDDFYPIDTVYFVSSLISLYYLYFNLKTQNFVNSDSAVPGLNRNSAYQLEAIIPEPEILKDFERIVQPFFGQKNLLERQNQKLKEARDILLTRLMNQTIEV